MSLLRQRTRAPQIAFLAGLLAAGVCLGQRRMVFERDVEKAIATAEAQGVSYFLDFETSWCAPCQKMNRQVYISSAVADAARGFVLIKVDGDERRDLMAHHGVRGFPTGILFGPDGYEITRFSGYRGVADMVAFFGRASQGGSRSTAPVRDGQIVRAEPAELPWVQGAFLVWQVGTPPAGAAASELLYFRLDAGIDGYEVEIVEARAEGLIQSLFDALAKDEAPDLLLLYGLTGVARDGEADEELAEILAEVAGALDHGRQFLVPMSRNHAQARSWVAARQSGSGRR